MRSARARYAVAHEQPVHPRQTGFCGKRSQLFAIIFKKEKTLEFPRVFRGEKM
jgi:hypothetical protein